MAERNFVRAALAVFWSFFGVRRRSDYDADARQLRPAQVILAGVIGGAVFVGVMVLLVYGVMHFMT